jgi:hypothetical protein
MSGMVNGRMLVASCHSHSAATASASAWVGNTSGALAGERSVRPSSVSCHPSPCGVGGRHTA